MVTLAFVGLALWTVPTLAGQAEVGTAVTIYNQGFALVKDTRVLNLREGRQEVRLEEVAARIEPSSVGIRSVTAPGSLEVLEQNYQYDLISAWTLLAKSVGQRITLHRTLPNGTKERVSGTLLSTPENGFVLRGDDGRILLDPGGEIEIGSIPAGLISKPSLVWDVLTSRAGAHNVEVSYLTGGMQWNADYVLTLDKDGSAGNLKGWVTIQNNSGVTFVDSRLKLLAGDVARATEPSASAPGSEGGIKYKDKSGFVEEQFADYHLYSLERPATVRNKEQKQISLLEVPTVRVQRRLVLDAIRNAGYQNPGEGEIGTGLMRPQIRIDIRNAKANGLGMPLPKGPFKVFQRDRTGSVQFLGEDTIDHTPKDETISLVVGRAFDIVCERRRTAFAWLDSARRGARETFEIEIRNHKANVETITVIERHQGEYKIIKPNLPFTQPENGTVVWEVRVKGNESTKLIYTVETTW